MGSCDFARGIAEGVRIGGLGDWRIGGLEDWGIGGLGDWRIGGFSRVERVERVEGIGEL